MRPQYHFRRVNDDVLIWDVRRLVELSRGLEVRQVAVADIREIEEPYWFHDDAPTCARVVEHARLIGEADPDYPIILSSDGRVMDGMHRVGRALLEGRTHIPAVRFGRDPEPDYRNRRPDELPYD